MISFSAIAEKWALTEQHARWEETFSESAGFTPGITQWLSSESALRATAAEVSLSKETIDWLVRESAPLACSPEWCRLVAHLHYLLIVRSPEVPPSAADMPLLPETLGVPADIFYLHVYLSGIGAMKRRYEEKGIPEEVVRNTLSDLRVRVEAYKQEKGRWGLNNSGWLQNYPLQRLYALGRLQFAFHKFVWPFKVYTHRETGAIEALPVAGEIVREDGQFASADDGIASPGQWKTFLEESTTTVTGHRTDGREGIILRDLITLRREEWEEAIAPDDLTLAIHIPASGPLSIAECVEGLRQVENFYSRYFPDFRFKGVSCATWLLDPQFEKQLGSEANIVQFAHLFHSLPFPGANDKQLFERVFQNVRAPLDQLPADNSLRRAVIAHMKAGGRWRTGCGVIPRSLLPR